MDGIEQRADPVQRNAGADHRRQRQQHELRQCQPPGRQPPGHIAQQRQMGGDEAEGEQPEPERAGENEGGREVEMHISPVMIIDRAESRRRV